MEEVTVRLKDSSMDGWSDASKAYHLDWAMVQLMDRPKEFH